MGKLQPYNLFGGAYSDASLAWTRQDTVNYLPIRAERPGARSIAKFEQVPGMRVFASIGTGPHRGGRDVEGKCFVVSGNKLYQITPAGVATELGTVPGTGPVCITHNQIDGGNQVVIGNGTSGYVYNTATDTFAQITDDGFPGLVSTDFLGQYVLGVEPQRRFWFHSALNDAADYNTLDRYTAESAPDRIVGLIASHSEALVFGERSIEPWVNQVEDNAAATAFQRNSSAIIEVGCASAHTICRLDNSVFFLSNHGQVMRLNGYTPVPVSTRAMEAAFAKCDLSRAFAYTWEDRGHVVYYITFPDGHTWGYDVAQQEWARRESYGLNRWRLNSLFKWNGHWFGGDSTSGKFYQLDWDYALDGCDRMVRRRVGGVIHNNGNYLTLDAVRIGYNSGGVESAIHDGATLIGDAPDGTVGEPYSYQYVITRAFPGQDVSPVVNGTLPPGLELSDDGLLQGTPTTAGLFTWNIVVVDECGNESSVQADNATIVSIASVILDDAPILYWKLNETSGTNVVDYSGYNRPGTITGTPTQSSTGLTLTALAQGVYFPGAVGGSVLDVGGDTSWALEAVVTRAGTGGTVWEGIAANFGSPNFGYVNCMLSLSGDDLGHGKPQGGFTDAGLNMNTSGPGATLANGVRTHLMIVRDPGVGGLGALRLYVNGVEAVANTTFTSTLVGNPTNGAKFLVGNDADTGSYYASSYGFIGKIEHVAVYDTALSAARALIHAQALGLA